MITSDQEKKNSSPPKQDSVENDANKGDKEEENTSNQSKNNVTVNINSATYANRLGNEQVQQDQDNASENRREIEEILAVQAYIQEKFKQKDSIQKEIQTTYNNKICTFHCRWKGKIN